MLKKIKGLISKTKEYKEMELKGELDTNTKDIVSVSKAIALYSVLPILLSYIVSYILRVEQGIYVWFITLGVWAIWYKNTGLLVHSAVADAKKEMVQEANEKSSFKQITTNKNTAT